MPYAHTTYAQLKTQLAGRLGDPNKRFWIDTELGIYLTEALRTFGVLAGFWRARSVVNTVPTVAFYDLTAIPILTPTVTDRDLIQSIQFSLLESTSTQSSWLGTDQFTYADIAQAVLKRRNQFLSDTGIILTNFVLTLTYPPPTGRQVLPDTTIDVRRIAWKGMAPLDYYTTLWRSDEYELSTGNPDWTDPSTPQSFSIMAPPPLEFQLAPPPIVEGVMDMITVQATPPLDPATLATVLGIPNDLTPAIKWGAMADLLGIDGQARDIQRSQFCEKRYAQFVQLARILAVVVNCQLNGVPAIASSLIEFDSAFPDFQNDIGVPRYIGLGGWNMLATYPVPDNIYSITLDVVRNAPVPTADADQIQIGREQLDAILDYSEHLAMFKCGGAEFAATERQADNFLLQSVTYNQRLSASAKYIITPKQESSREKYARPRRSESNSLGAMPSIQESQSFVAGNAPVRLKR